MCIFQTDLNEQLFHTAPANSFRNRPRPIQKPNRNDDKYSTNLTNKRANLSNRLNKEEYKKSPNYSLSPFLFFYNKAEKSGIKKKKREKEAEEFFAHATVQTFFVLVYRTREIGRARENLFREWFTSKVRDNGEFNEDRREIGEKRGGGKRDTRHRCRRLFRRVKKAG